MKYKIYKNPDEECDSDDVRFITADGEEKGFGFLPRGDKVIALKKCPACGKENYVFNVLSGQCTWCPFTTSLVQPV